MPHYSQKREETKLANKQKLQSASSNSYAPNSSNAHRASIASAAATAARQKQVKEVGESTAPNAAAGIAALAAAAANRKKSEENGRLATVAAETRNEVDPSSSFAGASASIHAHKDDATAPSAGVLAMAAAVAARKRAERSNLAAPETGIAAVAQQRNGADSSSALEISENGAGLGDAVAIAAAGSMAFSAGSNARSDDSKATGGVAVTSQSLATTTSENEESKQPFSNAYKLRSTRSNQAEWVDAVKRAIQECSATTHATVKGDAATLDEDFLVQAPPTPTRYTQTDWLAAINSTITKVKKKPKAPKP